MQFCTWETFRSASYLIIHPILDAPTINISAIFYVTLNYIISHKFRDNVLIAKRDDTLALRWFYD